MDVNEYTLSLINNYVSATGMGDAKRMSLTPADYMLFRKQALEECKAVPAMTLTPPQSEEKPASAPIPIRTKEQKPKQQKKESIKPQTEEWPFETEEEEESGMEAALRGVPG